METKLFDRSNILQNWQDIIREARIGPQGHARYAPFKPTFEYALGNLKRVGGSGDGGKWLIGTDAERQAGQRYVVLSIGSHMDFKFEESIKAEVPAAVIYTFDCTVTEAQARSKAVPKYVTFHRVCIDEVSSADKSRLTYDDILTLIGESKVDLLKIDAEGAEFKLMSSIVESTRHEGRSPPRQISFEMHFYTNFPGMWEGSGPGVVPSATAKANGEWRPRSGMAQSQHAMASMLLELDSIGFRIL